MTMRLHTINAIRLRYRNVIRSATVTAIVAFTVTMFGILAWLSIHAVAEASQRVSEARAKQDYAERTTSEVLSVLEGKTVMTTKGAVAHVEWQRVELVDGLAGKR